MTSVIPDYEMEFFMNNYGKFSEDPKALFGDAYDLTLADWEQVYDDWIARNN